MTNRCPNCNKFVSLEMQEPEILGVDISGTEVNGTCCLILSCAECGEELKDAELDFSAEINHECDRDEDEFDVIGESAEPTERFQTEDRHGKPIKRMRYQRHFYGADVAISIQCGHCKEEFEVSEQVEEQASGFNDLT